MSAKKILWSESIRSRGEGGRAHFLARASLRALSAESASALLESARNDNPDLIILPAEPLDLPQLEICRRLRGDPRTRSIPILALLPADAAAEPLWEAGCTEVIDAALGAADMQERIVALLGLRLRRYPRYPIVLPVARGRIFHEFLGYTNAVSEGGMGFETISRIRVGEQIPLRIYRKTEEKPIAAAGRVAGVRPNIETGIGYAVGIEFMHLSQPDRERLVELFPRDGSLTWALDGPPENPPPDPPPAAPAN